MCVNDAASSVWLVPQRGGRGCCFRFASDINLSTPVYFLAAIVSEAVSVKCVFTTPQVVFGCLAEGLLVYSVEVPSHFSLCCADARVCRCTSLIYSRTRPNQYMQENFAFFQLQLGILIVKPQHLSDGRVAPFQGFWVDVTTPIEISTDLKCA